MKIDHIGYAVKRMDGAIDSFQKLGFSFEPEIDDIKRNIKIAFGGKDGYRIELVMSLDKTKESPVDSQIMKNGPTPYHICYSSEHFDLDIQELKEKGFRVVIPPSEAIACGGKRVVFMMNLGMGLLEIVEA